MPAHVFVLYAGEELCDERLEAKHVPAHVCVLYASGEPQALMAEFMVRKKARTPPH